MSKTAKNPNDVPPVTRMLARLTGARLCFGRPVESNGRTVIPVASVRSAGGGGFGSGGPQEASGTGGGGGGALDARPVGFIEISAEGTRFERIDDGRTALRALAAASIAVIVLGRVANRRRRRLPAGPRRQLRAATPPPPPAARGRGHKGQPHKGLLRARHSSQRS